MSGTELPSLSLGRYPLVLLPVGLLGALTAMATTRAVRGRSPLGLIALGLGAVALSGVAMILGRNGPSETVAHEVPRRRTARELFTQEARRESRGFADTVERAVRRTDRFPTISPPPKPGATRPS